MFDFLNTSNILDSILNLLPRSPFKEYIFDISQNEMFNHVIGWLNWLIPVKVILSITSLWLGSISLYYVYSIVLRWIKAVH